MRGYRLLLRTCRLVNAADDAAALPAGEVPKAKTISPVDAELIINTLKNALIRKELKFDMQTYGLYLYYVTHPNLFHRSPRSEDSENYFKPQKSTQQLAQEMESERSKKHLAVVDSVLNSNPPEAFKELLGRDIPKDELADLIRTAIRRIAARDAKDIRKGSSVNLKYLRNFDKKAKTLIGGINNGTNK